MNYNKSFKIINENVCKIIESLRERKRYLNELSEISKIKSKNNLLKNLNNLHKANILKVERNKSNTFYLLNYDNSLTIAILQLINLIKFNKLPFERRKAISEVISKTRPLIAVLFGSTAKGGFTKKSDIDLLIVPYKKEKISAKIREISGIYGVKINPILISFKDFEKKDETLIHILKTGYPITGEIYFYNELKKI